MTPSEQIETQAATITRQNAEILRYQRREQAHLRIIEKQADTIEAMRAAADPKRIAQAIFKEQSQ